MKAMLPKDQMHVNFIPNDIPNNQPAESKKMQGTIFSVLLHCSTYFHSDDINSEFLRGAPAP